MNPGSDTPILFNPSKPGLVYFAGYPLFPDRNERCARLSTVRKVEASVALWEVWPGERTVDWSAIEAIREPWIRQGKKADIRIMTAHNRVFFSPPWLFDNKGIALVAAGWFEDFEEEQLSWIPEGGCSGLTSAAGCVLSGTRSMLLDGASGGAGRLYSRRKETITGEEYLLQVNYRVLKSAAVSFSAGPRTVKKWELPAGSSGLLQLRFFAGDERRYELTADSGAILLDSLGMHQVSGAGSTNAGFPDYFSPAFQKHWDWFLHALAQRYSGDPGIEDISISGLGRWEEMILDDDVPGRLLPQWKARGFTARAYLDLVIGLMDKHRVLFPDNALKQQIAFGMESGGDMGMMYHRTAEAAYARGIGIKQNGLSERYDTWECNEDSYCSWVFSSYRYADSMQLTHETGAQIYNNGADATGHPVSLIHRGLMNSIDCLYLYDMDILEENISRYFPYLNAMCSRAPVTRFFCMAGKYTMDNEFAQGTTSYCNQWFGIRQNHPPPYGADYHVFTPGPQEFLSQPRQYYLRDGRSEYGMLDGVPFMETVSGAGCLFFDIDQRLLFHGITGTLLTFSHFDSRGAFFVYYWDIHTRRFEYCGSLGGSNSRTWKHTKIFLGDRLASERNCGEDRHVNLVLLWNPEGEDKTGRLSFAAMDCVPLRDYRNAEADARSSTRKNDGRLVPLKNRLEGCITVSAGESWAGLALRVFTRTQEKNEITLTIYEGEGESGSGLAWKMCCCRSFSWVPDGRELEAYCHMAEGRQFRWVLEAAEGDFFLLFKDDFTPCITPIGYAETSIALDAVPMINGSYRFSKPFRALTGLSAGERVCIKEAHSGELFPLADLICREDGTAEFDPLPPGDYLFECTTIPEAAVLLNPRGEALPPDEAVSPRAVWNGEWKITAGENCSQAKGIPQEVRFYTANTGAVNFLTLWWADSDQRRGCVHIPVVPFDPYIREYRFALCGEVPHTWTELRLADAFGRQLHSNEVSDIELVCSEGEFR